MDEKLFKQFMIGAVGILIILLVGSYGYQSTHFNRQTTINNIPVGGLTVKQAYQKVKQTPRQLKVSVNHHVVYTGHITNSGFTATDQAKFKTALKQQFSFFPSQQRYNIVVEPTKLAKPELAAAVQATQHQLQTMNANRKAPQDAYAKYQNGKIKIIPAVNGSQYTLKHLSTTLKQQYANGRINLTPRLKRPLAANSRQVNQQKQKLAQLTDQQVTYQVQNRRYQFKANDILTMATYQNGHYQFDTSRINKKIARINHQQATLGKSFKFKTHDGKTITTTNQGTYGWKIDPNKAGQSLAQALAEHKTHLNAKNDLSGSGFNQHGTGYQTTANHGIGDTYAEVSIAKQHAWFYRNGKCILSTDIVSGSTHDNNATPKGVFYIMYQHTPSILRGKNDDGSSYASKVQYWSPFTIDGCGFHDAPWRTDWSKTAYQQRHGGSHGCINMKNDVAGLGYHALTPNEPVIIY